MKTTNQAYAELWEAMEKGRRIFTTCGNEEDAKFLKMAQSLLDELRAELPDDKVNAAIVKAAKIARIEVQ
jgi:hypothetical protein